MKFFETRLKIDFEALSLGRENELLKEYTSLNSNAQITQLKNFATKVDFSDGEAFLFEILLGIKEDLFRLESLIKNQTSLLSLANEGIICALNYEFIEFSEAVLNPQERYYARIQITQKPLAFFCEATSENTAKFVKIKSEDKMLYDGFVVGVQRELINELKRSKND